MKSNAFQNRRKVNVFKIVKHANILIKLDLIFATTREKRKEHTLKERLRSKKTPIVMLTGVGMGTEARLFIKRYAKLVAMKQNEE